MYGQFAFMGVNEINILLVFCSHKLHRTYKIYKYIAYLLQNIIVFSLIICVKIISFIPVGV